MSYYDACYLIIWHTNCERILEPISLRKDVQLVHNTMIVIFGAKPNILKHTEVVSILLLFLAVVT